MKMETNKEDFVKYIFTDNGSVLRTKTLRNNGLSSRDIKKLTDKGIIEQVRWGYYKLSDESSFSDIQVLITLFPDGVLYLESALDHYGYTERTPAAWKIAVDEKTSRTRFRIPYPKVEPHFISSAKFPIGITKTTIEGTEIKIYDRERTICDCLLHRNKIDPEVFNQAIQAYLKDNNRREYVLAEYASKLRVMRKVKEVLGIWL